MQLINNRGDNIINGKYAAIILKYYLLFFLIFGILAVSCGGSRNENANPPSERNLDSEIPRPSWSSAVGTDIYGRWSDLTVKGVTQKFRLILPGTFVMGCSDSETDAAWDNCKRTKSDTPRSWLVATPHMVTLSRAFWLADSSCTQELWMSVMHSNPSLFHDGYQRPVEQVSWYDCQKMLIELSSKVPGASVRLPTEAEWEYACRAGSMTALYSGGIEYIDQDSAPALDPIAWYSGNCGIYDADQMAVDIEVDQIKKRGFSRAGSHPVKQKQPNAWGLYDMLGNVFQWCIDWYGPYPIDAVGDTSGPFSGSDRVDRGGSWSSIPAVCRCANRYGDPPASRSPFIGFRLCISAFPDQLPK
jgi:formylglycine-generating enzyme required for sulfatase activity